MDLVLVAIPTYRRPDGLARLLTSLRQTESDVPFRVCVVDNDAGRQEGLALVRQRFPEVEAVVEPRQGLASVRNRMLEVFRADERATWLAMLDDDQSVDPAWLAAALDMARSERAGVVACAVHAVFDADGHGAAAGSIYRRETSQDGRVAALTGAGGIVISRSCLSRAGWPDFSSRYDGSGGEDAFFFAALKRSGAVFARASAAIVNEHYPASRLTYGWALRRAFRIGITDTDVCLRHGGQNGLVATAGLMSRAGLCFLRGLYKLALSARTEGARLDGLCQFCRGAGILRRLLVSSDLPDDYGAGRS